MEPKQGENKRRSEGQELFKGCIDDVEVVVILSESAVKVNQDGQKTPKGKDIGVGTEKCNEGDKTKKKPAPECKNKNNVGEKKKKPKPWVFCPFCVII